MHSIVFRDAADVIALTIFGFVIGEIRLQDLVEAIAKVYRRRSGPTKYDINSSWVSEIHQRLPEFQSAWEHSGPALLQGCPEVSIEEVSSFAFANQTFCIIPRNPSRTHIPSAASLAHI